MSSIRTDILLRVYFAFGLIVLFAAAVLFQLFKVQVLQGAHWRKEAKSSATQFKTVEAVRGNIYGVDGSLLATSVPEYNIRIDLLATGIEEDAVFEEKVDSLATSLSIFFKDKTPSEYSRFLRDGRKKKDRYKLISKNVSHADMLKIRKFPMFNMKNNGGGWIAEQKNHRIKPFKDLAARTIGYKNDNVQPVGLEGAYGKYINGESGRRLMYKIAGGFWVPVNNSNEIETKDGADIISTIDIGIQDVAQRALLTQLKKSDADHGCVILMEVNTGEIRAIANYTKAKDGTYQELFNYAIRESLDPGSTFKLASYMVGLEEGKFTKDTKVETGSGVYNVYNLKASDLDHGPYGNITVQRAFELSSNVAIVKLTDENYRNNPQDFVNRLYKFGLTEELGIRIEGEGKPLVRFPGGPGWSGVALASMCYGYGLRVTPLQLLSFSNAVANNGRKMKPLFVEKIVSKDGVVKTFPVEELNHAICSKETIRQAKAMLEAVVETGTASGIKSDKYRIAGKTGTAKFGYTKNKNERGHYNSSFIGYFPADNPKYSICVVITDPNRDKGYYASQVAAPVFKAISDRIWATMIDTSKQLKPKEAQILAEKMKPVMVEDKNEISRKLPTKNLPNQRIVAVPNKGVNAVPDLTGMGLKDAVFILENMGMNVKILGRGVIAKQSIAAGTHITKGTEIIIELM